VNDEIRRCRRFGWTSLAAWAPAAAARPQQPPSLNEDIAKGLRDNRAVPWAVSRPLKWSDLEAVPPESPGQQGAVTGYSLFHGARCTGRRFEFKVVTAFLPGQSWVRPIVLGDPSKSVSALRHEQTHFDLAEVSARRMRRRFADLTNPCRETPEAMEAIAAAFVNDDVAAQARYDEETRHGLRADRQRQWDADTAELLTSLAKFDGKS
jgi:hypothetical protein